MSLYQLPTNVIVRLCTLMWQFERDLSNDAFLIQIAPKKNLSGFLFTQHVHVQTIFFIGMYVGFSCIVFFHLSN